MYRGLWILEDAVYHSYSEHSDKLVLWVRKLIVVVDRQLFGRNYCMISFYCTRSEDDSCFYFLQALGAWIMNGLKIRDVVGNILKASQG